MHPLVSVIIPFYNATAYIEQTLHSVYAQTYKNIEVICIDNNSSDDTVEKINHLKHVNNWELILLLETRQGAPHARNRGLEHSKGEYIQFLDSDDFLIREKLEKQIRYFNNHAVDFITAEHYEIAAGNRHYKKRNFQDSWQGLITGAIGITSSALFKRDVLMNVSGFNPALASNQEKDLYFRLLKNGCRHAQLEEPLFEKNFSVHSISNKTNPSSHIITKIIFVNAVKQYLKEKDSNARLVNLIHTQCFALFQKLCQYTGYKARKSIYDYYTKYYEFNVWITDTSLKNKVVMTLFSPVGYFFMHKGIKLIKAKKVLHLPSK